MKLFSFILVPSMLDTKFQNTVNKFKQNLQYFLNGLLFPPKKFPNHLDF